MKQNKKKLHHDYLLITIILENINNVILNMVNSFYILLNTSISNTSINSNISYGITSDVCIFKKDLFFHSNASILTLHDKNKRQNHTTCYKTEKYCRSRRFLIFCQNFHVFNFIWQFRRIPIAIVFVWSDACCKSHDVGNVGLFVNFME